MAAEPAATVDESHRSPVLDQVKRSQQLAVHLQGNGEPEPQSEPPDPTRHIDRQPDQRAVSLREFPSPRKREPARGLTYPATSTWLAHSRTNSPHQVGGQSGSLDFVGEPRSGGRLRRPTTLASRRASWRQFGQLWQ